MTNTTARIRNLSKATINLELFLEARKLQAISYKGYMDGSYDEHAVSIICSTTANTFVIAIADDTDYYVTECWTAEQMEQLLHASAFVTVADYLELF